MGSLSLFSRSSSRPLLRCQAITQRALERVIARDVALMAEQAARDPAEVRKQKELVPPWMKDGEPEVPTPRPAARTPQPPAPPANSLWVQHLMERREAQEAALGPKVDYPKPLMKLRGRTPLTPGADQSQEWSREARDVEQKALVRLLHGLKDRLRHETERTKCVEARLANHSSRQRSATPLHFPASVASKRFDQLGANSKAMSMARAKSCGWYPSQAAGFVPADLASRPPRVPPKRTDRLLAYPYAIADIAGATA